MVGKDLKWGSSGNLCPCAQLLPRIWPSFPEQLPPLVLALGPRPTQTALPL
jgi:hypothetical protein